MWADLTAMDGLGVVGSLMICTAYGLNSFGRIDPEGVRYQLANAVGSILLLISLYFRPNPGAILIEVIWLAIASAALIRIWRGR